MKFESLNLVHLNLFEFSSYRLFLNSFYEQAKLENSKYSLRYLAKRLGLASASTLNMILKGQRNPSGDLAERICEMLRFSKAESQYFKTLVLLEKNQLSEDEKIKLQQKLRKINPKANVEIINEKEFALISHWYSFAIRQMINLKDFKSDLHWMYKRLRGKVQKSKIDEALRTLEDLGLIERRNENYICVDKHFQTTNGIPSEAIKRYHEQMLLLAREAIRDVDVPLRDIGASTFNIDLKDLPEMMRELNDFRKSFYKKYESKQGEGTYQINIQLFPLTKV